MFSVHKNRVILFALSHNFPFSVVFFTTYIYIYNEVIPMSGVKKYLEERNLRRFTGYGFTRVEKALAVGIKRELFSRFSLEGRANF